MIGVDTNVISALLRGKNHDLPNEELYIPYIVLAELQAGIATGNNPQKNRPLLDSFLSDKNITISPGLAPETITNYVEIYGYLRKKKVLQYPPMIFGLQQNACIFQCRC